jgi:hypothetical protein
MILKNEIELANTREKLLELERRYDTRRNETASNPRVHELTLQSLKRIINQLKEEIALFEVHQIARK